MSELELASGAKTISNPSKCINQFQTVINIDEASCHLVLVTMKRSFLLAINCKGFGSLSHPNTDRVFPREQLICGFMESNPALRGLCLAIGDHSTCLIPSDNSLASATLATRLSKKFNKNRPVYVANNLQLPYDSLDSSTMMSKLYMKVFQFVGANYHCERPDGPMKCDASSTKFENVHKIEQSTER